MADSVCLFIISIIFRWNISGFCCCSQMDVWTDWCSSKLCFAEPCRVLPKVVYLLCSGPPWAPQILWYSLVLPEGSIIGSDASVPFLTHVHTIRRMLISQQGERSNSHFSGFLRTFLSVFGCFYVLYMTFRPVGLLCTITVAFKCFLWNSSCDWYTTDLMSLNFPFVSRHKVPLIYS